ncbi:ScyD/ScyE family protein [Membranihabitans maritimus]|uniref:ScyD/ScyE family protein n=1 Tax=Membranihabitans maritimus TaxID=2904244 RepID=UPI001F2C1C1E|nr:ScyD/ScyE family protein [Membranihabitans maritimus]
MKHLFTLLMIFSAFTAFSQSEITIVADNLSQPVGIEPGPEGTILVAEAGTGQNDGGVTAIHPVLGQVKVLDSMPSYFDTVSQEVVGPMRVQMLDETMAAVFISEVPGPLGSSILIYDARDLLLSGGTLGPDDALHQIKVGEYVLSQGYEASNPFSLVHNGCDMYIVDAAANAIIRRNGLTGVMSVFAEFDQVANPLPFGPPMTDAVPTRIVRDTSGFLVSSLTGFPFADSVSKVYAVDDEGNVSVRDSGYTLVTDMTLDPEGDGFFALQMATFRSDSTPPFVINSAIITQTHADGSRDTVASGFGPSPGLFVAGDGSFYVTNLFAGTVTRIEPTSTSLTKPAVKILKSMQVFPNPAENDINLRYDLKESGDTHIEIFNSLGQNIVRKEIGHQQSGSQNIRVDLSSLNSTPGQVYYILLKSGKSWFQSAFTTGR